MVRLFQVRKESRVSLPVSQQTSPPSPVDLSSGPPTKSQGFVLQLWDFESTVVGMELSQLCQFWGVCVCVLQSIGDIDVN